jgi:acyl dehydratase
MPTGLTSGPICRDQRDDPDPVDGDTIQARLTCKRKTDKPARKGQPPQGVVAWDVQVTNQHGDLVASYDILTLVLKRAG